MAKLYNRVKVTTATTGTGTVTLGSAASNAFCTFAEAGVQNADVVTYVIEENTDFEIGRGTYTASGTTLSRDTVLLSKIGGVAGTTKMSLAGAATVRIDAAAQDIGPTHGQCRLVLSGASLVLVPYNGNKLIVNGSVCTIPDGGVSLAPTGLTAATFYYIYAMASGGIVNALAASTATYAAQAGTGVMTKNGDVTQTLVGAAFTDAGPAWADSTAKRWVLSWFNRTQKFANGLFSTLRTTTSTAIIEINAETRAQFIAWNDQIHILHTLTQHAQGSAASNLNTSIGLDGIAISSAVVSPPAGNMIENFSHSYVSGSVGEGASHFSTIMGSVNAGTGTWFPAAGVCTVIWG